MKDSPAFYVPSVDRDHDPKTGALKSSPGQLSEGKHLKEKPHEPCEAGPHLTDKSGSEAQSSGSQPVKHFTNRKVRHPSLRSEPHESLVPASKPEVPAQLSPAEVRLLTQTHGPNVSPSSRPARH